MIIQIIPPPNIFRGGIEMRESYILDSRASNPDRSARSQDPPNDSARFCFQKPGLLHSSTHSKPSKFNSDKYSGAVVPFRVTSTSDNDKIRQTRNQEENGIFYCQREGDPTYWKVWVYDTDVWEFEAGFPVDEPFSYHEGPEIQTVFMRFIE